MKKKKLLILGATGSIGTSTLKVVREYAEHFIITGITAGTDSDGLTGIMEEFGDCATGLASTGEINENGKVSAVRDVNTYLARTCEYDIMVNGLVGSVGFSPTYEAIKRDKIIALANKETIVAYGSVINRALKKSRASIRPVDSEHSALWQLLEQYGSETERIIITASGGAALRHKSGELKLKDILRHPVWNMGPKVTIDSSTMANKGLEVIEASMLFNIAPEKIDVLIHPQSVIHAMVVLNDGTVLSHMAYPDMILPIEYALFYPERPGRRMIRGLSLTEYRNLEFFEPDYEKYPALKTAYAAAGKGKTYPAVFNSANEAAVRLFIEGKIGFNDISEIIDSAVRQHKPAGTVNIKTISAAEELTKSRIMKRY